MRNGGGQILAEGIMRWIPILDTHFTHNHVAYGWLIPLSLLCSSSHQLADHIDHWEWRKKEKNGTDCKAVTRVAIDFRVELMKVQSALTEPWQLQRNYIEHFALVAIRLQIKCVQWWQNKGFKLLKRHSLKNNLLKCCFTRDWTIVWFHPKSNWTLSKL